MHRVQAAEPEAQGPGAAPQRAQGQEEVLGLWRYVSSGLLLKVSRCRLLRPGDGVREASTDKQSV